MTVKQRALFLCCILLVSFSPRTSKASSYCPGCAAALVGAAVGVGVGIGTAVYFVHRSHTSLSGCVTQSDKGLTISGKNDTYELVDAPGEVKPGRRVSLRGHKSKTGSSHIFRVDHLSHDYGACGS